MSIKSDSVDEVLVVETPERVALHFPLASLGNRFLACAIDHLLQGLVIAMILVLGYHLNTTIHALGLRFQDPRFATRGMELLGELNIWLTGLGILLLFAILFGYFILFETLWSGQTPGKRLLHLRVISGDGRPVTFFAVMTRNLIRLADMVVPPFYSVGLLAVFASRHSQRLGDFVAGTVVIKESPGTAPTFDELFAGALSDPAHGRLVPPVNFTGNVGLVTPAEILAVEIFLRRRAQLPESPRQWLAWRVAAPLLERLRPEYDPQNFSYEGFLEELLEKWEGAGRNAGR
jgi:uncharacterized RDD family membrane protein YckC